jgi:dienelactone hydrolase/pimeloyl-ACP methyl ester carboxylesterase
MGPLALCLAASSSTCAGDAIVQAGKPAESLKKESPGDGLRRYLLEQAHEQFEARRKAIAAIKTPADIARRQRDLRAFFLNSLGDLPARTPLHPRAIGTLKRTGYHVEKIIFESRPNHHVTASLYVPEGTPPYPGVLVPCGHSDNAKAAVENQQICILLAKNGMAALCYDPIGQGERNQLLDASGKPVVRNTTEHTMAGLGALLVGRQLASYRIWDGFRALDYLASRPEIDRARLGCTGNSGGGTLTSYLMALDDRISVAAPSCYITSLERLFATIGPQDAEQNITGQVAAGLEHADYVTLRAPKPTLLAVGTRDFFDIKGSWDTFREVKLIYGRLGLGERVDLFESDEGHGFTKPRRIAAARWMKRWLLKQDEALDEPDFAVSTDAELQCTRSGQVLTEFTGVSVFDLNRARAQELRAARDAAGASRSASAFRGEVKKLLGLEHWTPKPVVPLVVCEAHAARLLRFGVEPGLDLAAVETRFGRDGPTLVAVGWDGLPQQRREVYQLQSPPGRLIAVDPRGMGMTSASDEPARRGSPFGLDWKEAYIALHLNRPLLGQCVADLLGILAGLDAEGGPKRPAGFHLLGIGQGGPVVLHAALLDERGLIKKVTLEESLVSWADVVEKGTSRDQLSTLVPGALQVYDLPELAARLAPLPLKIVTPLDALGKPVSPQAMEQAYAPCTRAYGQHGALVLDAGQGATPIR